MHYDRTSPLAEISEGIPGYCFAKFGGVQGWAKIDNRYIVDLSYRRYIGSIFFKISPIIDTVYRHFSIFEIIKGRFRDESVSAASKRVRALSQRSLFLCATVIGHCINGNVCTMSKRRQSDTASLFFLPTKQHYDSVEQLYQAVYKSQQQGRAGWWSCVKVVKLSDKVVLDCLTCHKELCGASASPCTNTSTREVEEENEGEYVNKRVRSLFY